MSTERDVRSNRESDGDKSSVDRPFRVHFDNLPGPAYMWQRDGDDFRLIAHNRAAAALPFSNIAKFVGMSVRELQRGSTHDMHADLALCAARGIVLHREVDHRYLESTTVRRLALSLIPVSPDIVVLHTDDITERERTGHALRASEQKYRTIVDTAHEGILASTRTAWRPTSISARPRFLATPATSFSDAPLSISWMSRCTRKRGDYELGAKPA